MIEEEHVSQYESLKDPSATWLEDLLMHEYTECYLYYSCMMTECDLYIRKIWEECLMQEISHLHKAKELLEKYENKSWQQVIGGCGDFPDILVLGPNIDYRFEIKENPLPELRNRRCDNTSIGRIPACTPASASSRGTTADNCQCPLNK